MIYNFSSDELEGDDVGEPRYIHNPDYSGLSDEDIRIMAETGINIASESVRRGVDDSILIHAFIKWGVEHLSNCSKCGAELTGLHFDKCGGDVCIAG